MWGSSKAKKYKGKYELANLEFQRGGRVLEKILSMGGGMDIFWNMQWLPWHIYVDVYFTL